MKRYLGPGAITVLSAIAAVVFIALAGEAWPGAPHVGLAILLFFVGIAAILIQISGAPPTQSGRVKLLRVVAVLVLAIPPVAVAVPILWAIATRGDVAWLALPFAIPGLVIGPLAVFALIRAAPLEFGR